MGLGFVRVGQAQGAGALLAVAKLETEHLKGSDLETHFVYVPQLLSATQRASLLPESHMFLIFSCSFSEVTLPLLSSVPFGL